VTLRRAGAFVAFAAAAAVAFVVAFATYVYVGVIAGGRQAAGTIAGLGVHAPVHVVRDERGIPHVRAQREDDLFLAEGFLQGEDRLFQLDLYRRLVYGRLSEILGRPTLATDIASRTIDVRAIADAQLARTSPTERRALDAFAAGVNAAIRLRPLPPEFRMLAYRPEPWTARDSLVASFSTVLALTDSWGDVATRAAVIAATGPRGRDAFFSISDPKYDAPIAPTAPAPVAPLPLLGLPYPNASPLEVAQNDTHASRGSNEMAAGAHRTTTHRALLANDPHLELRMPGVWWLAELQAPGLHVAGATLVGAPGIVLGHNEHVAWGATNGTVATVRVFREEFTGARTYRAGARTLQASVRRETIRVRFAPAVEREYLRTRHGFVFQDEGSSKLAAAWTADLDRRSSLEAFDGLDRAPTAAAALRALSRYPGPPQNFVVADDRGEAGYMLAGSIPLDDAWGLAERDGKGGAESAKGVPFARLPHIAASRDTVAFTANARTYGRGYPYRLSAAFSPPYRAARIAAMLRTRGERIGPETFSAIQADTMSLVERELADTVAAALATQVTARGRDRERVRVALAAWDGRFTSQSHAGTYVNAIRRAATERLVRMHMPPDLARRYLLSDAGSAFVALMRALRDRPRGWVPRDDYPAFLRASVDEALAAMHARGTLDATWSEVGARTAQHPLAAFGLSAWNGVRFPGLGDAYSPHVQAPANSQSFRAVWDVGNWSAGGIVIPQGESGEPGSPHYRDLAPRWLAGSLVPFPFGEAAVRRAARTTLDLQP